MRTLIALADSYDSNRVHRRLADEVRDWIGPVYGFVLDLGAGSGLSTHGAVLSAQVVLLDLSAKMLAHARRTSPEASCVRADAHRLPFPEATFDDVICVTVDGFRDLQTS